MPLSNLFQLFWFLMQDEKSSKVPAQLCNRIFRASHTSLCSTDFHCLRPGKDIATSAKWRGTSPDAQRDVSLH